MIHLNSVIVLLAAATLVVFIYVYRVIRSPTKLFHIDIVALRTIVIFLAMYILNDYYTDHSIMCLYYDPICNLGGPCDRYCTFSYFSYMHILLPPIYFIISCFTLWRRGLLFKPYGVKYDGKKKEKTDRDKLPVDKLDIMEKKIELMMRQIKYLKGKIDEISDVSSPVEEDAGKYEEEREPENTQLRGGRIVKPGRNIMNIERKSGEGEKDTEEYILCPNCGFKVPPGTEFCPRCGIRIEKYP